MGLKDWLFGRKGGEGEAAAAGKPTGDKGIARLRKKLMNKYVQSMERKRVIQLLAQNGSDEAIVALLSRFTYVTDGSIVDEDEKTMTYELIKAMGDQAQTALVTFIMSEVAIYWPLRILTELKGEERAIEVLMAALGTISDRFERNMERMHNIVSCFRDYRHPVVMKKLLELAHDEEEEIRFLAVDGLSTFDQEQEAVDAIIERLVDPEETTRVKTFITDLLLERKWKVKRFKKELAGKLPENYFVDDTGIVQRRF